MWSLIGFVVFLLITGFILINLVLPLLHGLLTLLVVGVAILVLFALAKMLWQAVFGRPKQLEDDELHWRYDNMHYRMDDLERMFRKWQAR